MVRQYSIFLSVIAAAAVLHAAEPFVVSGLASFVNTATARDPRCREKELLVDKALEQKTSIRDAALLPDLEIASAVGPAPAYTVTQNGAGESVENYDFNNIGPFFGFELKALQPLNFGRYKNGMHAADCNVALSRQEVKKNVVDMNQYFQELYFKSLYACQMAALAREVKGTLEKAGHRLDSLLNEDAPNVSQSDLLELKTYMFKADDGLYQAEYGLEAAKSAMSFSLRADTVSLNDTLLYLRGEKILSLDSLNVLLQQNHPDLKRLAVGIEAQTALVKVAWSEMFPDAFIIGSYKFTKSWNGEQYAPNSIERLLDPYNKTSGSLGIGVRLKMNLWSTKDKYHKEKLELETLRQKESYALRGLSLELENQCKKVHMHYLRQSSAAASLQSAEAWLKGAAMKYDLDASQVGGLLKAYEKDVQAQKDYYECVLDYDLAVAELISKTGLTLREYQNLSTTGSKTPGGSHE